MEETSPFPNLKTIQIGSKFANKKGKITPVKKSMITLSHRWIRTEEKGETCGNNVRRFTSAGSHLNQCTRT